MERSDLGSGRDPSRKQRRGQRGSSASPRARRSDLTGHSYGQQQERLDGSAPPRSEKARRRRPKGKRKASSKCKGKGSPKPKPTPPTSLSKLERDTIRACAKTVAEHGPQMEARIRSGKDARMDSGVWAFLREESVARAYYHELLLWHQEKAQAELARGGRVTGDTSSSFEPEPKPEPEPEPEPASPASPDYRRAQCDAHELTPLLGVDMTVADWVQLLSATTSRGLGVQSHVAQLSREQQELLHEVARAREEQEQVARLERKVEEAQRELIRARACGRTSGVQPPETRLEAGPGMKHPVVVVRKKRGRKIESEGGALSVPAAAEPDKSEAEEGVPPRFRPDELPHEQRGWVDVDQDLGALSAGDGQPGHVGSKGGQGAGRLYRGIAGQTIRQPRPVPGAVDADATVEERQKESSHSILVTTCQFASDGGAAAQSLTASG
eukprot:COSAG02_NODE_3957_length_5984_cov_19.884112_1_plen_440_part_00